MIKPTGIGRRIRDTRQDLGLSQAELGRRLTPPVTRQRVSRYEAATTEEQVSRFETTELTSLLSLATIERLAKALGVEPGWLAWGRK